MIELAKIIIEELAKRKGYKNTQLHNKDELVNDIPTVFLANHNQGHNLSYITTALQEHLSRDVHPVINEDIFKEQSYFKRELLRSLVYNAGAVPIQKRIILNGDGKPKIKSDFKNTLFTYKEILKQGDHLLIRPTGKISLDGRVDYSSPDTVQFNERHIAALNWLMNGKVKFQYIYSTTDEVFEVNHVCVGPSFTADKPISFLEGMIQSTKVITGLQLCAFLKEQKLDTIFFPESIKHLRNKGYIIPKPPCTNGCGGLTKHGLLTATEVNNYKAFNSGRKELELYDLENTSSKTIITDNLGFQYNQIMHMTEKLYEELSCLIPKKDKDYKS